MQVTNNFKRITLLTLSSFSIILLYYPNYSSCPRGGGTMKWYFPDLPFSVFSFASFSVALFCSLSVLVISWVALMLYNSLSVSVFCNLERFFITLFFLSVLFNDTFIGLDFSLSPVFVPILTTFLKQLLSACRYSKSTEKKCVFASLQSEGIFSVVSFTPWIKMFYLYLNCLLFPLLILRPEVVFNLLVPDPKAIFYSLIHLLDRVALYCTKHKIHRHLLFQQGVLNLIHDTFVEQNFNLKEEEIFFVTQSIKSTVAKHLAISLVPFTNYRLCCMIYHPVTIK